MIDKIEHFFATTFITVFIGYFFDLIFGVIIASLFSVFKEIYDYKIDKEDVEAKDIVADVLGILFGVVVISFLRIPFS